MTGIRVLHDSGHFIQEDRNGIAVEGWILLMSVTHSYAGPIAFPRLHEWEEFFSIK